MFPAEKHFRPLLEEVTEILQKSQTASLVVFCPHFKVYSAGKDPVGTQEHEVWIPYRNSGGEKTPSG